MARWQVWRQDERGNRSIVDTCGDRIEALARMLVLQTASSQPHWVSGDPGPVCRSNRDLYRRLRALGREMSASGRTLSSYLRALHLVSTPLRDRTGGLDLDMVAALFTAAARTEPPPFDPAWRGADLRYRDPEDYRHWERVVLSQIADLEDVAQWSPQGATSSGLDAPRPEGSGLRATGAHWDNLDPATYLEVAVAGVLGGWEPGDDVRVPARRLVAPGVLAPGPEPVEIRGLSWAELAGFAVRGQVSE